MHTLSPEESGGIFNGGLGPRPGTPGSHRGGERQSGAARAAARALNIELFVVAISYSIIFACIILAHGRLADDSGRASQMSSCAAGPRAIMLLSQQACEAE